MDGQAASDSVAGFVMRGDAELRFAVSHGCTTIGLDHEVTSAKDGWVREIDGRPAWSVFREYLNGNPEDLSAEGSVYLCLGVNPNQTGYADPGQYVIRTPMLLDKDNGALFFPGGGLSTGTKIRLTRRDAHLIRNSARECALSILQDTHGERPAFMMQFDCAGRGRILFGNNAAPEILKPLQDVLGHDIPWIGFHTYGEIAPHEGAPCFHNYSVALCAVFEKGKAQ